MKSVWLVIEEGFGHVPYPGASVYVFEDVESALGKANELWRTWKHHREYADWEESGNPYFLRFESARLNVNVRIRVCKSEIL